MKARILASSLAIMTLSLTACEGRLGASGALADLDMTPETREEAKMTPPPSPGELEDTRVGQRIWRLAPEQYTGEVARIFGPGAPDVILPRAASEYGITNIAATAVVDLGNASAFTEAARAIGAWAADTQAAPCASWGTAACLDEILQTIPEQAFRRPVTQGERDELRTLFAALETDYGFEYAYAGLVRAILLSPDFLYRTEIGPPDAAGDLVTLTDPEIANLLAFAITNEAPDAELRAATNLQDPSVREMHARRLMARSAGIWQRFFWEWLHLGTLESQGNEVGLDPALVGQMREEYDRFVSEIVVESRGTLQDLLTAQHTWVTPELAEHYGATHPGSGVMRVELPSTQRGGLLTMGVWLVAHGKRGRANVVRRGMAVYREAMCSHIEPPAGLDVNAAQNDLISPDATVRQIVDARGETPTCGGCHRVADPVGLVFENFASDGTWQTTYATDGLPVEPEVEVPGIGAFDNAAAFSAALANDLGFQFCVVERFAHFVLGVDVGSPRAIAWQRDIVQEFIDQGGSFEALLLAVVRSPAFVERAKEL